MSKKTLTQKLSTAERQLAIKEKEVSILYSQIKEYRGRKLPAVSDHAIVRYLERSGKVDMNQIISEIRSDAVLKMHRIFGDGTFPVGEDTTRVVIKDNTIVTVII